MSTFLQQNSSPARLILPVTMPVALYGGGRENWFKPVLPIGRVEEQRNVSHNRCTAYVQSEMGMTACAHWILRIWFCTRKSETSSMKNGIWQQNNNGESITTTQPSVHQMNTNPSNTNAKTDERFLISSNYDWYCPVLPHSKWSNPWWTTSLRSCGIFVILLVWLRYDFFYVIIAHTFSF
jgi:hypothetical protein